MRRSRRSSTSSSRPSRNSSALRTSSAYAAASINPTHGAVQRRIWCSRQGRVRLLNTVSSQVRSLNTFCMSWMLLRTALALENGPK